MHLLGRRQGLHEAQQQLEGCLCAQAKLQVQRDLLAKKLAELGVKDPLPALPLPEDRQSISSTVSQSRLLCSGSCRDGVLPSWCTAHASFQEQEKSGTSALETLKNHITGIFSPKYSVSSWVPPATLLSTQLPC